MKKMTLFLCSLLIAAGSAWAQNDAKKATAEITFAVSVHCDNCKKKIENSLPHEKGVKDLKVSVEEKTVWVQFDPIQTNVATLRTAIEKNGFEVTVKASETKADKPAKKDVDKSKKKERKEGKQKKERGKKRSEQAPAAE